MSTLRIISGCYSGYTCVKLMSYPEYTLAGILRSGPDCYVVNLSRLLVMNLFTTQ
jgi:hypothetical protein